MQKKIKIGLSVFFAALAVTLAFSVNALAFFIVILYGVFVWTSEIIDFGIQKVSKWVR